MTQLARTHTLNTHHSYFLLCISSIECHSEAISGVGLLLCCWLRYPMTSFILNVDVWVFEEKNKALAAVTNQSTPLNWTDAEQNSALPPHSGVETGLKRLNIASSTDKQHTFLFELSLSRLLNHLFGELLSFKHIKMLKFTLFLNYISVMRAFPIVILFVLYINMVQDPHLNQCD